MSDRCSLARSVDPADWCRWSPHRRAEWVGGYAALLAWPILRLIDLASLPRRLRQSEEQCRRLVYEVTEQRGTIDAQNTFIDRLNEELSDTLPVFPSIGCATKLGRCDMGRLYVRSQVVGLEIAIYPDERIEGQRQRLLIEQAADRIGRQLTESVIADLERQFWEMEVRRAS